MAGRPVLGRPPRHGPRSGAEPLLGEILFHDLFVGGDATAVGDHAVGASPALGRAVGRHLGHLRGLGEPVAAAGLLAMVRQAGIE